MTESEKETGILSQIENHIRLWAFQNRFNPKRINAEIFTHFGKRRREMTVPELEECLSHVKRTYPMGRIRGTGRPTH
jgi:hypothetical protein